MNGLYFMYPWVLLFTVLPLGYFAFLFIAKKEALLEIFDAKVLARLSLGDEGISHKLRQGLLVLSAVLMLISLARPVMDNGDTTVELEGLTVLSALDISGSMRSQDMFPNRLSFAKAKMGMFFDAMPSDEIGVMAFAYSPFVLAPFSTDKETLKMMVSGVDDSYINMGSTDFLALAELASSLLEEKDPKVLVLFSDGGDEEAISGFAQKLKDENIDLYVVLVGTKQGAPVLDKEGKPVKLPDASIAISQRNDALGEVAKDLGGAFVVAGNGKEDIAQLVKVIKAKYQNQKQGQVKIRQGIEYFTLPLALGLFVLLLALGSLPQRRKR
jgi:Ca-activated chloride channel family protein